MKPWHHHEHITGPAHLSVHRSTPPTRGHYTYSASEIKVTAEKAPQLVDISDAVRQVVRGAGVAHGQCVLYCQHTTAALVINESEPLLAQDIADFLEKLASMHADYRHDDFGIRTENLVDDHGKNAHAHLKAMVLGSSLTIPVRDGELGLGFWQHVFLVEMDKSKERTLFVQVSGLALEVPPEETLHDHLGEPLRGDAEEALRGDAREPLREASRETLAEDLGKSSAEGSEQVLGKDSRPA